VPEKELRRFARACAFPVPPPLCPQAGHSRRELVRDLLRPLLREYPPARMNLVRAGLRGLDQADQVAAKAKKSHEDPAAECS
jgi:tRNA(Ile)-lysidine synthase TilS/MesJ